MKQPETKGEKLHDALMGCLAQNRSGHPYLHCSRVCNETEFWVKDGQKECFAAQNVSGAFKIHHPNAAKDKPCWLVCVDEGIITNQKSALAHGRSLSRCDNLLFNDEVFYYVEAKMEVQAGNWESEFQDAVKNKIPATKTFLLSALSQVEHSMPQKVCVAVIFPRSNNRYPRYNSQKQETLRLDAEKALGQKVLKLVLDEVIVL